MMTRSGSGSTPCPVDALLRLGTVAGLTDGQLLARFAGRRDEAAEAAFAALVRRHGPMVLDVCRRAMVDRHEAEDAFQATFLVLARKAPTLRRPDPLGPWLHGVARRVTLHARRGRARRGLLVRRAAEAAGGLPAVEVGAEAALSRREDGEALHREIARLPAIYRDAVILCELQGLTHEEAGRQLGRPAGTVGVRLMRARARLRDRLGRGERAPWLARGDAAPSTRLIERTSSAAWMFAPKAAAASASAGPVTLAEGVLRAMTLSTLKTSAAVLAALSLGLAAAFAATADHPPTARAAPPPAPAADGPPPLLSNGGFERGDGPAPADWRSGGAIPGVEYLWDRASARGGTSSLRLKKTADRYFPVAEWAQTFPRTGDAPRLKISAYVKADAVSKAILDVQFLDAAGDWSHQWACYIGPKQGGGGTPATHDWTLYEGTVDIPKGTARIVVAPQTYGPGDVRFDDIAAEYVGGAAEKPK